MNRRQFIRTTAAASLAFPAIVRSAAPNSRVSVAVIGTSRTPNGGDGRGSELAVGLAGLKDVDVVALCDVDSNYLGKAIESVSKKAAKAPRGEKDLRRLLEDKSIDGVAIATPDHWHAPAAILACSAGKHVYVEKPCSHNPHEGELLVAAARKHNRLVQHGTQRRSWPGIQEGIAKLNEGAIGRVLSAKAYYFNKRPTIGKGKTVPAPAELDWSLWQGPAPEREFHDNYVHYHWHWFWHWGTGELGNNGVHTLDVCRWGLGADYARRVTSGGEKLRYDDDQETPDTNTATFDFGGKTITWECRSWAGKTPLDPKDDVVFFGENGRLGISGNGYTIYDLAGKEVAKGTGAGGNASHLQNFVDAIRGDAKLNAEIEEGYKSTMLCHLGNIAWRTTGAVTLDPSTHRLVDAPAGEKLWRREYRSGWEPVV